MKANLQEEVAKLSSPPFAKDEKVLLISHSRIISCMLADGYDEKTGKYINRKYFKNCEVVPHIFEGLKVNKK